MAWDAKNAFVRLLGRLLTPDEIVQGTLNASQDAIRVEVTAPTVADADTAAAIAAVDAAPDRVITYAYLDAGDATDRRLNTVTYSSASLSLNYVDTYAYGGSAGGYYVTSVTRS